MPTPSLANGTTDASGRHPSGRHPSGRHDVVVLGGGLVGLTLALSLAQHGIDVHVVDRADPANMTAPDFDGRASAISSSSWKMFEAIGLAGHLQGKGQPIQRIWVSDGLKGKPLDFTAGADDDPLGIMFENRALRLALFEAARDSERITLDMPVTVEGKEYGEHGVDVSLGDGRTLSASLLVAAEGRNSPTRTELGLNPAHWKYRHRAIVTAFGHEKPHGQVAYEIFYPAGPFAILPLPDLGPDEAHRHRSAIVWTVAEKDAEGMLALGERAFIAEAQKRMGGLLGEIRLIAPRSSYPLGFHHTARMVGQRVALIGDAAHGIHPIAGQGFNLGLRDIAALTEVLVEGMRHGLEPGDAQLLARYEKWRALDSLMVAGATDGLTRLFGLPGRPAAAMRRFGIGLVQKTAPVKRFFMQEARGQSGELPKLLRGHLV